MHEVFLSLCHPTLFSIFFTSNNDFFLAIASLLLWIPINLHTLHILKKRNFSRTWIHKNSAVSVFVLLYFASLFFFASHLWGKWGKKLLHLRLSAPYAQIFYFISKHYGSRAECKPISVHRRRREKSTVRCSHSGSNNLPFIINYIDWCYLVTVSCI